MKKRIIILTIFALLFLTFPLILSGCDNTTEMQFNDYEIKMIFNEENYSLSASQRVCYVNNSSNALSEIRFHLYPNAFREDSKTEVVALNDKQSAYPNGESYGHIDINEVYTDDSQLQFNIDGEDFNILIVSLPTQVFPDEKFTLFINFDVFLPNMNHRFGYGDNVINCANFYPIACVYKDGIGWSEDLYHSNGDPFYSDCANYDVELSYPSEYTIASTGIAENQENGNMKTSKIQANLVRDFAFVLSKNFQFEKTEVDGIDIYYYGYKNDNNINSSLSTAVNAITTFNNLFGQYPYQSLSVVKTNFVYGGMEFPNLVMISDDCDSQTDYNYVIVHEIAHQWWYGVVGNDQYNEAWLDESLAEFSTWLFFKNNPDYGINYYDLVKNATETYKYFVKIYTNIVGDVDTSMCRSLKEFSTQPEYVQCIYTKGPIMYATLQDMIGEKKLLKALKDYYEKYSYKNSSAPELIASFIKSTGYDLEGFFNSWLNGEVQIV